MRGCSARGTRRNPTRTISFTPRPDWYFYFLFYLLRIFKWPESVILATVGIPTILLIILILVPFFDRRRERRLIRRPVAVVAALLVIASMGVLTYKGATARRGPGEREPREGAGVGWRHSSCRRTPSPGAEIFAPS